MKDAPHSTAPRLRAADVALSAGIFAAAVLVYLPSMSGALIWNDTDYVTAPGLKSLHGLWLIWTRPGVTQQYYPLLHSFFWVQSRLWGEAPLGYHAVTVALHASASVLLAWVLRGLFNGTALSPCLDGGEWLAALLFAIHPAHVESVAWISEQKNTLSLALYLGSALAYLRFDTTRGRRAYAWALALFLASLLCKTVTATLPAAMLVALWWKRGRISWKRDVVPLVPWFVVGIAAGLFTSWVERHYVGAEGGDFEIAGLQRLLVAGRAVWFYTGTLAWPFGLNFIYPRWVLDTHSLGQWLYPAAVLALVGALWLLRGKARGPLAAYLFFVGSLLPALGFVNLYGARYSWVWDHWQYLPDIGPISLAGAGLVFAWRRLRPGLRWVGPWIAAVLALGLGSLTSAHCAMFHDNESLYLDTLARNPGSWMAHNNLGLAWSKLPGRLDDAIAQYQAALRLKPDIAETHTNLGRAWLQTPGRTDDAVAEFREAIRVDPKYPDAHFYLANSLVAKGDIKEAIENYETALKYDPGLPEASNNLGILLCRTGRGAEGLSRIEAALRMEPDFLPAHFARGAALLQMGRIQDAQAEFERVLALRPGYEPALRMMQLIRSRQ
ncbi:MAG TPA: tetratricopeptide repeat protein [Opitutaceae bacterium]